MLVKAIRKVAAGDNFISPQLTEAVTFSGASIKANPTTQMTARELEILRLLGRGDKISEVADVLEISYKTVANTTSVLKQKLCSQESFGPGPHRRRDGAGLAFSILFAVRFLIETSAPPPDLPAENY